MDQPSLSFGSEPRVSQLPAHGAGSPDMSRQGAMHRLVAFRLEDQRYALYLTVVERVLRIVAVTPLPKAPAIVLGVVNFHGQVIPVFDLQRRFSLSSHSHGLSSTLLLVRTKRRTMAFPVNEVLGVQEVAGDIVTSSAAVVPGVGLVVGMVALSDGVLFIHDPDAFLSLDEEHQLTEVLEGKPA